MEPLNTAESISLGLDANELNEKKKPLIRASLFHCTPFHEKILPMFKSSSSALSN